MKTVYLVRSIVECERCDGSGVVEDPDWAEVTCPACRGAGYHERDAVPLEVALRALGIDTVQLRKLLETIAWN